MSISEPEKMSGYSLIEMMVGLTVGLLVLSSIGALFVPSLRTYRQTQAVAEIQEAERFAEIVLADTINQIGYIGCDSTDKGRSAIVNTVKLPGGKNLDTGWALDYASPVKVYSAETDLADENIISQELQNRRLKDTNGTIIGDAFYTLSAEPTPLVIAVHDSANQTISFRGNYKNQLSNGKYLLLNDCSQTAVTQIANPNFDDNGTTADESDDTTTISYAIAAASGSSEPDTINCTATDKDDNTNDLGIVFLGGSSEASCENEITRSLYSNYTFDPGSTSAIAEAFFYYLAYPAGSRKDNTPSLYRVTIDSKGKLGTSQELIAGVENMRAMYGIRQSSDGTIKYVSAKNFDGNQDIDGQGENETWEDVLTMQLYLLLRSRGGRGEKGSTDVQAYDFPNAEGDMVTCGASSNDSSACPQITLSSFNESSRYRRVINKVFYLRNYAL